MMASASGKSSGTSVTTSKVSGVASVPTPGDPRRNPPLSRAGNDGDDIRASVTVVIVVVICFSEGMRTDGNEAAKGVAALAISGKSAEQRLVVRRDQVAQLVVVSEP
jgi:hypothetical protein